MITKFKLYETIKKSPKTKKILVKDYKIGDYVICESESFPMLSDFTSSNVGQIIDILNIRERFDNYVIQYDYIPDNLKHSFQIQCHDNDPNKKYENSVTVTRTEIKFLSDKKSDLEYLSNSKKFNI